MPEWIPLLSGKPFEAFSAAEFKQHVESLYDKEEVVRPPFTWTVNKKGSFCLRVNREPKYLLVSELLDVVGKSGQPEEALREKLRKSKIEVREG